MDWVLFEFIMKFLFSCKRRRKRSDSPVDASKIGPDASTIAPIFLGLLLLHNNVAPVLESAFEIGARSLILINRRE